MKLWRIEATVMPKNGVNDPQGEAIRGGLASMEFTGVRDVRAGKVIAVVVEAASREVALETGTAMCDRLLANPVIEQYTIEVVEAASTAAGGRT